MPAHSCDLIRCPFIKHLAERAGSHFRLCKPKPPPSLFSGPSVGGVWLRCRGDWSQSSTGGPLKVTPPCHSFAYRLKQSLNQAKTKLGRIPHSNNTSHVRSVHCTLMNRQIIESQAVIRRACQIGDSFTSSRLFINATTGIFSVKYSNYAARMCRVDLGFSLPIHQVEKAYFHQSFNDDSIDVLRGAWLHYYISQ